MDPFPVVERIFCDLFELEEGSLTLSMRREDIAGWDSVAQLKLLLMLEDEGVSLDPDEAISLSSVGEVVAAVRRQRSRG